MMNAETAREIRENYAKKEMENNLFERFGCVIEAVAKYRDSFVFFNETLTEKEKSFLQNKYGFSVSENKLDCFNTVCIGWTKSGRK